MLLNAEEIILLLNVEQISALLDATQNKITINSSASRHISGGLVHRCCGGQIINDLAA